MNMECSYEAWIDEDIYYAINSTEGHDYTSKIEEKGICLKDKSPKKINKILKKLNFDLTLYDLHMDALIYQGSWEIRQDLLNGKISKSEHDKIFQAIYYGYDILEKSIKESFKTNDFVLSLKEKDKAVQIEMIHKERKRNKDMMMNFKELNAYHLPVDIERNKHVIRLIEQRSPDIIEFIDGQCYVSITSHLDELMSRILDDTSDYNDKYYYYDKDFGHPYTMLIYGVLYEEFLIKLLDEINKLTLPNTNFIDNYAMFKLSKKNGSKINLIKVLKALYSLQLIEKSDGSGFPSIKEFMSSFGEFLGRDDFADYANDIKGSKKNSKDLASYLEVFECLKQDAKKDYEDYYK